MRKIVLPNGKLKRDVKTGTPTPAPQPKPELLTLWDYEQALHSQSACNLSGIVRAFAKVTEKLWNEAHAAGQGTDFVNEHPISRLYAEQIYHLAGGWKETSYHDADVAVTGKIAELKALAAKPAEVPA
jgi:hypothetical protein